MRTRILSTAVLAIVGVNASLAAQTTTRPTPERDEPRIMTRTLRSAMPDDPDRPRLGLTLAAGGAIDTLGLLVDEVTAGGPADKAGIKAGDRIVSINGVNLRLAAADAEDEEMRGVTQRRLTRELARRKAGDDVDLRLLRDGKTMALKVKTVAADELRPRTATFVRSARPNPDRASLGIGLGSTGSKRDTLGILVASLSSDGPAENAGLEEGDRLASINGVDLRVAREDVGDWASSNAKVRRLARELEKVKAGDEVELRVYRAGQPRTVKVKTAAARDVDRNGRQMFIIGGNASGGDFGVTVPPLPPLPPMPPGAPMAPMAPRPPMPPDAPSFYFFDGDREGTATLRLSPRMRTEVRDRTREAIERALELAPRARTKVRVEMEDGGEGEVISRPGALPPKGVTRVVTVRSV